MGNVTQGHGEGSLRRLGEVAGALLGPLADQRSARQRTMRKSHRGATPTVEELRAKASALLPSASGERTAAAPAVCRQCGGVGWVRVAEIGAHSNWQTRYAACACRAEAQARDRWERALAASDMSPELRSLDFAGYDPRYNAAALQAAWAWALDGATTGDDASSAPWLFLYGGPGSGKTHLLAAAFNALMAGENGSGHYPLYTVYPALVHYIREGLDEPDSREYGARFRAVREAPILILDDLGAEKRSEWTDELLFKLLDYRYRQALPTAVASNLIPGDLEPRIASRLQDRGLSTVILMAGPDYRLSGQRASQRASQRAARRSSGANGKKGAAR